MIPFAITAIIIFTVKMICQFSMVKTKEYWGSFIKNVQYYEPWNEYIHQTCTRTVSCGKDCTTTETYDCSYVRYHDAEYYINTTTGEKIEIDKDQFNYYVARFRNKSFVDMDRSYYTEDGDMYQSDWKEDSASSVPVTTVHSYDNKIKAADQSIFHYTTVSKEDKDKYSLKEYPPVKEYLQDCIIGDSGTFNQQDLTGINYVNALLGHQMQVRVYLLIYRNQPIDASFLQESY